MYHTRCIHVCMHASYALCSLVFMPTTVGLRSDALALARISAPRYNLRCLVLCGSISTYVEMRWQHQQRARYVQATTQASNTWTSQLEESINGLNIFNECRTRAADLSRSLPCKAPCINYLVLVSYIRSAVVVNCYLFYCSWLLRVKSFYSQLTCPCRWWQVPLMLYYNITPRQLDGTDGDI